MNAPVRYGQFEDALVENTVVDCRGRGPRLLGGVRFGRRIRAPTQAAAHLYAELHRRWLHLDRPDLGRKRVYARHIDHLQL